MLRLRSDRYSAAHELEVGFNPRPRSRVPIASTNAVLHLIAIAHEFDIPLSMDDFDRISEHTPFICDLSPGGKYAAKDYQDAGGSRLLAKRLMERGQLHDQPTVSGKTLFEEANAAVVGLGRRLLPLP